MRAKRPRTELIQLLSEQRQALSASCEGYDKGNEWEAARLATVVYTLVHDGGSIVSLLTQLGLRAGLRFISTRRHSLPPGAGVPSFSSPPLTGFMGGAGGMRCVPRFVLGKAEPPTQIQFDTWWTKEDVERTYWKGAPELTRRRLVFALRHQDGGSHIGELTDPAYVRLKAGGGMFGNSADGSPRAMVEAASAAMRQIGWEVTETLNQLGEVK